MDLPLAWPHVAALAEPAIYDGGVGEFCHVGVYGLKYGSTRRCEDMLAQ